MCQKHKCKSCDNMREAVEMIYGYCRICACTKLSENERLKQGIQKPSCPSCKPGVMTKHIDTNKHNLITYRCDSCKEVLTDAREFKRVALIKEVERLRGALEQQIKTYDSLTKYNDRGDAYNMYIIATSALED